MWTGYSGHVNATKKILKKFPDISIDQRGYCPGRVTASALAYAVVSGSLDTVKVLVEYKASIDCRASNGETPFTLACHPDRLHILEYFLDICRISINARCPGKGRGGTVLYRASGLGHTAVVKVLLEHGADPNIGLSRTKGNIRPIHIVVELGHVERVNLLLKYGANVTARTVPLFNGAAAGETPLTLAEKFGHGEILGKLRKAKARPENRRDGAV